MIPRWITSASIVIVALAYFVGCSLYLSPGIFMPHIDFTSPDVQFLTNMLAAGHIALASIVAFASYRRSAAMLTGVLLMYSLTNVQGAIIGITRNDTNLIISTAVLFLLSMIMVYGLRSAKNPEA